MTEVKEAWIRFMAPVVPQSATALLNAIDSKIAEGCGRIHLMISSPGGSVFHGLSIYNLLKGAPVEVVTYNFGSVDSIGVVIFCAGDKRVSVPHARFLLHGVSTTFQGNQTLDEKDLEERIKGLRIDYQNISRVIAATTGRESDAIVTDMETRTTLNPEQAIEYGLVHEITSVLFPAGADLVIINESSAQQGSQQIQFPIRLPIRNVTAPSTEGFSGSRLDGDATQFRG
jgi:ATP-dependent Clp protease protease subunit